LHEAELKAPRRWKVSDYSSSRPSFTKTNLSAAQHVTHSYLFKLYSLLSKYNSEFVTPVAHWA